jgi:hypothetical protein
MKVVPGSLSLLLFVKKEVEGNMYSITFTIMLFTVDIKK